MENILWGADLVSMYRPCLMDDHFNIVNQISAPVTTLSDEVLLGNGNRKYLFIQNQGTDSIYVQFAMPQVGNQGIRIYPNGDIELFKPPCQPVYIIAASGTQTV